MSPIADAAISARTGRLHAFLADRSPGAAWSTLLALVSGTLTFLTTAGGLFTPLSWLQCALVAGIAAGLMAPSIGMAAVAGLLAALAGSVARAVAHLPAATGMGGPDVLQAAVAAVVCGLAAATSRIVARRASGYASALVLFVVLLLLANLWYTVLWGNSVSLIDPSGGLAPPFNQQLVRGEVPAAVAGSDYASYFRVFEAVRRGEPYYPAVARAYDENPGWKGGPWSVTDVRMPTLYWAWALLPDARWVVVAFLVLASIATLAVAPLHASLIKTPLVIPGCAAVASYFLYFPWHFVIFATEEWAAALGVCALAAYAVSTRSSRWKSWTITAVALAAAAVLVREIMLFLPAAGLVSALFGDARQRRFRTVAWVGALAVVGASYVGHYVAARPYLHPTGRLTPAGRGGVRFMLLAFDFGTEFLGKGGLVPLALVALGFAGAFVFPEVRQRVLVTTWLVATSVSFLFFGNNASVGPGVTQNYWGACILPALYALIPAAFVVLPGATLKQDRDRAAADRGQPDVGIEECA